MPVFIAFAAFLLLVFGHRLGLPIGHLGRTTGPFGNTRKSPGQKSGVRTLHLKWCSTMTAVAWRVGVLRVDLQAEIWIVSEREASYFSCSTSFALPMLRVRF